jgi:beta-glucanase (GH16 family)
MAPFRVALGAGAVALSLGLARAPPAVARDAGWTLTWSDDFKGERLDPAKWSIVQDCWGGGNDERQCYTADAVSVGGGELRLTARSQDVVGPARPAGSPLGQGAMRVRPYASGKVSTVGKASFRYGRLEVRARFPRGQGLWSAIWLLPEHDNYGPFPRSGEIDMAEAVNLGAGAGDLVQAARHFGSSLQAIRSLTGRRRLKDPFGFHVYALEWTPRAMTWFVDGAPYLRARTVKPFDQRYHLILNLAVGGRWPEANGAGIDPGALPATLAVDWVRVYERPNRLR